MLVADVFNVYLYPDSVSIIHDPNNEEGEDITSGIINVDIQYGTDIYEGPQQQIDTGQFTIVTRNPAMDPKINPNLKYNSGIKFVDTRINGFGETNEFFRGYVTDVQVEYQRKDDPIITITGTDIFGAMQRVVVDQDTHDEIIALSTGPSWNGLTFTEFMPYMNDFVSKYLSLDTIVGDGPSSHGFWFEASDSYAEQSFGYLGYSPAKYIPQVGESYLEVINKYAQTNMTSYSAKGPSGYYDITVSPFVKYDPNYWAPQSDPMLTYTNYDFSSDPVDARPYQSILITNGYNRVINQADISNEYRYVDDGELNSVSESFTRLSSQSIEDYAISRASISTIYPEDGALLNATWANRYSQNIFQVTQYPGQEIQQITFDNARLEDIENDFSYSGYNLNRMIRIKHQINDTETIDRVYDIAGISHNISPDNWEMSFTLKPSKEEIVFNYQGSFPTLEMNATSGDSNFNFTASLIDYDPATVNSVIWALSAVDSDEIRLIFPYAASGNMFQDNITRIGLTQTWNFDDDGILAPYSFDPDSTFQDPLDNRYGGYGTGNWTVYAYVLLSNFFTVVLQQNLVVGTPEVEANFGWSQNLTNNFGQVNFVDTSVNNETGEVDSYAWDFGDGNTSAERNPIHIYNPGPNDTEYEVSLTVFTYGEEEEKIYNTHTETVTLEQPAMTADYTFNQTDDTSIVTFTNTSTNVGFEEADAYFWEFDDGTTSTLKSPVHTFPASENVPITYSVSLTIRNIWEQTESVTKSVEVLSLNDAGSLSISNLRLTIDNFDTVTPSPNVPKYPYMIFLRARTSFTQANLIYLASTSRTGTTSNIIWYEADGTTAEAGDPFNLTRNPNITPTSQYGLSPWINNITTQSTKFVLNTAVNNSQNIKNIQMTLRDVDGSGSGGAPQNPIVNVDVPDSFGGYVNIGYFKVPAGKINPSAPYNTVSEGLKTMVARRPMPPNIPYFKYTFNNTIASFTSVETADSYAWDFGDGTTSTDKDPVHTFPSRGTYNVTLEVTNDAVVTRTTTEPVIVEALVPFDIRYVKFEQDEHDGTHAFDTPWLTNFTMRNIQDSLNTYIIYTPGAPYEALQVSKTVAKQDFYSMEYTPVDGSFSFDPTTNPYWFWLINSDNGLRAKSLDAGFLTEWNLICDFKQAWKNVSDFTVDAGKSSISPNPTVAAGISYSIYVTDHTGPTINPGAVTWTKVGNITPTALVEGQTKYSLVVI